MTPRDVADLLARAYAYGETAWSETAVSECLSNPSTVAVLNPRAVALARVVSDEAEVLSVAVHPEYQNRGLGRDLVTKLLTECRSRGAGQAFLEVSEHNLPARKLYEIMGFHAAGRRRAYYRSGQTGPTDAIVYRKTL